MKLSRWDESEVYKEISFILRKLDSLGVSEDSIFNSKVVIRHLTGYRPVIDYIFSSELDKHLQYHNGNIYELAEAAIVGLNYFFEQDKEIKRILGDEFEVLYELSIEIPSYISSSKSIEQSNRAKNKRVSNEKSLAQFWFKQNGREDMTGYEFLKALENANIATSERTASRWLNEFKKNIRH